MAGHRRHGAGGPGRTQNALHDADGYERKAAVQLHPAAAGIGAAVAGTGRSDPASSTPAPWRPCSYQKEAADKTQNALILQPDIAVRSTALCWNIRYSRRNRVMEIHALRQYRPVTGGMKMGLLSAASPMAMGFA